MTRVTKKQVAEARRTADRKERALIAFEAGMNVALEDLRPYATPKDREKRDVIYAAHAIVRKQALAASRQAERIRKEFAQQ